MGTFTDDQPLPNAALLLGLVVVFLILSFVTHLQQYYATYGLVYNEVKSTRLSLAERLRKLPLGYFGKRDLADLTETIIDRKSTRLNSSHSRASRMPSSA